MLAESYGVDSDIWSVTSFNELARDGHDTDRYNRLHPDAEPRKSYVQMCLENSEGPVIAATDYMKWYADQIRAWVPGQYHVLGTDGFGRSDVRKKLRRFFEVDRQHVVVAALHALALQEQVPPGVVDEAIREFGIDPEKTNPREA